MMMLQTVQLMMMMFNLKSLSASGGSGWAYTDEDGTGPMNWGKNNKLCDGQRQSPINIQKNLTQYNSNLKPIELTTHWFQNAAGLDYTLENDGYGVKVKFQVRGNYVESPIMTKYNGETWRLVQFHFHWSGNNNTGSEHTIDGKAYPAELHLIHTNLKYTESISDAIKASDGLMVFGVFLEIIPSSTIPLGSQPYRFIQKLFSRFMDVPYKGDVSTLDELPIGDIFNTQALSSYYTYPGSLTTPTCDESVRWVVFSDTLRVTMEEMKKLRAINSKPKINYTDQMPSDSMIIPRFRPVQPLNGRIVQRSFESIEETSGANMKNINFFVFTIIVFGLAWY